jgi:segregation and condensation protein B
MSLLVRYTLKKQIEAMVFAVQGGLTTREIAERLKKPEKEVQKVLDDLAGDFEDRGFKVVSDGEKWKMIVEPAMTEVVKELTPMEFPKSIVQTLATIAYFNPAIQSDVIKIRGNKAYDHIKFLEQENFITSKEFGKTSKLRLTDKFFEYFEVKKGEEKYLFKEKGSQNKGD